jgi:CRISPR-associated protein Cmr1
MLTSLFPQNIKIEYKMEKIIFTCSTITPLVMNGALLETPELRPPGIKAALRFWWRALHGHLTINDLREKESSIFGSTNARSKVIVRVVEGLKDDLIENTDILPHKKSRPLPAYPSNQVFKIRIDFDSSTISKEKIESLFILACTLGGLGKRSRRGFGSVEILTIDSVASNEAEFIFPCSLLEIKKHLDILNPNRFSDPIDNKLSNQSITKDNYREEYPWLVDIQISSKKITVEDIGNRSHLAMSDNPFAYKNSVGAGNPRFASPIIVSILPDGHCVISTLNTVPPSKNSTVDMGIQTNFKNRLLLS